MANILCISSQVVSGHVGNTASAFALERLGHEAWQLPTVILSNHPGHTITFRRNIDVPTLQGLIDALEKNGKIKKIDAVLSGYLPTANHVVFTAAVVDALRKTNPKLLYLCDPAIGDTPNGLFLPEDVVDALRKLLIPLASILTPNSFELSHLTDRWVENPTHATHASEHLRMRTHGHDGVLFATSVPAAPNGVVGNMLSTLEGQHTINYTRKDNVPKGTGDLFAGLVLGHLLNDVSPKSALTLATDALSATIDISSGHDELQLSAAQGTWTAKQSTNVSAQS